MRMSGSSTMPASFSLGPCIPFPSLRIPPPSIGYPAHSRNQPCIAYPLRRLSTLIPPPRQNTLRYHGVFAARSKLRPLVVPREDSADETGIDHAAPLARPEPEAGRAPRTRSRRLDCASLLRRVFGEDISRCPECDGRLEVIACLTDPDVVGAILDHLGLSPGCPPRAPPTLRPAAELA
jgi:hypothetical protein